MKRFFAAVLFTAAGTAMLSAQFSEDIIRYTRLGNGAGARSLGMGNAYFGISDDYSGSISNPAGLAQLRRLEVMGGISNYSASNDATFISATQNASASATALDNIGFVFPFPTDRGSLVFAFGYNRISEFSAASTFSGFNTQSSIVRSYLNQGRSDFNLAYQTYLTDTNGTASSITGNVQQRGRTQEGGNLGQWAISMAIDIEENISFGVSLYVFSGMYDYTRNFLEEDVNNVYANASAGLSPDSAFVRYHRFYVDNFLSGEISGSAMHLGMMYRSERFRIGAVAKGPITLKVRENYTDEGESIFDATGTWSGNNPARKHSATATNEYGISSPWTLGAGVSLYLLQEFLVSADVEYSDWTQAEFTDEPVLEKNNIQMQSNFRATTGYRIGAEFDVPSTDLKLRGGYSVSPSPYKNDPASFDNTTITGGFGLFLQRNVVLDGAAAFGSFRTFRNHYTDPAVPNASRMEESVSTVAVNVTVSYRF